MPLSKAQLKDVCLEFGDSSCCRYLATDDVDYTKHHCLKANAQKKAKIDQQVEEYIKDAIKKGKDPYKDGTGTPLGDNCPGYPVMRIIEQGYDKP